jgi:hypothetical protein
MNNLMLYLLNFVILVHLINNLYILSFLKTDLLKYYMRTTMILQRLNNSATISSESDGEDQL